MVMIKKRAFLVLAVGVLMGTMAVAALADYSDRDLYEPSDASLSADPERSVGQVDVGEVRGPMETGAVPEWAEGSSEDFKKSTGEEPTMEVGGQTFRPGIDFGP
jgi:hypothetical protein